MLTTITIAIVEQIQEDRDYNKFYAQASVTLTEDIDNAELRLKGVDFSVHAAPILNARPGLNIFYISGSGYSPFKVGDTIQAVCFPKKRSASAMYLS